jgi:hypothetical protein
MNEQLRNLQFLRTHHGSSPRSSDDVFERGAGTMHAVDERQAKIDARYVPR